MTTNKVAKIEALLKGSVAMLGVPPYTASIDPKAIKAIGKHGTEVYLSNTVHKSVKIREVKKWDSEYNRRKRRVNDFLYIAEVSHV